MWGSPCRMRCRCSQSRLPTPFPSWSPARLRPRISTLVLLLPAPIASAVAQPDDIAAFSLQSSHPLHKTSKVRMLCCAVLCCAVLCCACAVLWLMQRRLQQRGLHAPAQPPLHPACLAGWHVPGHQCTMITCRRAGLNCSAAALSSMPASHPPVATLGVTSGRQATVLSAEPNPPKTEPNSPTSTQCHRRAASWRSMCPPLRTLWLPPRAPTRACRCAPEPHTAKTKHTTQIA